MKGWIAQNSGNGMITFFASKPKKFYLDHHKRRWWWVVEDNEGPSFQLTNSMTAHRELLPNKAVNYVHLIDMLGFKRKKDNKEGFGQWEGISIHEPRQVELNLNFIHE